MPTAAPAAYLNLAPPRTKPATAYGIIKAALGDPVR